MNGISIVIPAHNNAPVIHGTLTSVERAIAYLRHSKSSHRDVPYDVVVVDDGSSDNTWRVVSEFSSDKPHYALIRHEHASNAACARNHGVSAAKGDLLFFLDGDDCFLDNHIVVCCDILAKSDADFVKTGVLLDAPVHPDWEDRITNSLVINTAIRRTGHELVGGFPDFHIFQRVGNSLVHDSDIFQSVEDVFYNRALSRFLKGVITPAKTVRYTRSPGNAFDRQYEKFQVEFGAVKEEQSEERKFQEAFANMLSQYHFKKLARRLGGAQR